MLLLFEVIFPPSKLTPPVPPPAAFTLIAILEAFPPAREPLLPIVTPLLPLPFLFALSVIPNESVPPLSVLSAPLTVMASCASTVIVPLLAAVIAPSVALPIACVASPAVI